MTRAETILKYLNKSGLGLEIGPSHNPIAPKSAGYNVRILDHLSQSELKEKYKDHNVNLWAIEQVDYVWKGEDYIDLVDDVGSYDWIIASHVIEHTPDFIGFVRQCEALLSEEGVLALAVPDKRYCFDHFRQLTSLAQIIDAHYEGRKIHSPGSVAEYFLNVVSKGGQIAWGAGSAGEYRFVHTVEQAISGMTNVIANQAYLDVHAWCFTPDSFQLMIIDLALLGHTRFSVHDCQTTHGSEFYVWLTKSNSPPDSDRMSLLEAMKATMLKS